MTPATHERRVSMAATLLAAPGVLTAVWLALFQLSLDPPAAAPGPPSSFAAALRDDDVEAAFAHVRAGRDPNAPVAFSDAASGSEIGVTPLVIAAAYGRENSAAMLLGSGARPDAAGNRFARCLARRRGHDAIVELLDRFIVPPPPDVCPPGSPEDAPLAAYVE
jgi:hypothetical protein